MLLDTKLAVQILFTQNLPSDYDHARIAAISQEDFDFESLENSLKAMWDDRKRKKSGSKAMLSVSFPDAPNSEEKIGKL